MMRAQLTSNLIAITIRLGLKPIHPAVLTMTARADPFARTDVVNLVVVDLSSPPSYPPVESVVLTMIAKADTSAPTADVNLLDHVSLFLVVCVR